MSRAFNSLVSRGFSFGALGLTLAVSAGGCSCSSTTRPTLVTLVDPIDGATLTADDDEDPATEGVQYTIAATTQGLSADEAVQLLVDDAVATASVVGADGDVVFAGFTFPAGTFRLRAEARDGAVQSPEITITVEIDDVPACPSLSFVTPRPPASGGLMLGPDDDTDGTACGETFTTDVTISTDADAGATAQLFVNGTPRVMLPVDGTALTFAEVALGNRGDTANTLSVEISTGTGDPCSYDYPADVFVDCQGASCDVTSPIAAFLNGGDDVSDDEGFQTNVEVTTDGEGVGQPVALIIDGRSMGAPEEDPMAVGTGGVATFYNVDLTEGVHTAQARCSDAAGNLTLSGEVSWTVDTTPCEIAISGTDPMDSGEFIPEDDLDDATAGVQIDVLGTVGGDACEQLRVGHCSALPAFAAFADTEFTGRVTLSSSRSQSLCAEVEDEAGNVAQAMLDITFRSEAPQLEIVTPSSGDGFNVAGTAGRTADLNGSTTTCEVAFRVYCSDPGHDVTVTPEASTTAYDGGTAPCVATSGLPGGFAGQADFAMVSLPTVPRGASFNVVAHQTVGRVEGVATPIAVTSDCEAPVLHFARPLTCPATLHPASDDEDPAPGVQYRVTVLNTNDPPPSVDLEIRNGGVVYSATSTMRTGLTNIFAAANFGSGGMLEMEAVATDGGGNVGTTGVCDVLVADLPQVTITAPTNAAVLGAADDCGGPGGGYGVQVSATTDADASTGTAEIQVGAAGTPVAATIVAGSPNTITACVDATDGSAVPITVRATDARGTASATVRVTIDSQVPTTGIDDLRMHDTDPWPSRRGGRARLQWTAVGDEGGAALTRYELRCASTDITDEMAWSAATPAAFPIVPAGPGASQAGVASGFRITVVQYCALRGYDGANQPTPLSNSVLVEPELIQLEVTVGGSTRLGNAAAAIGDVNGDGHNDLLVSGRGMAYLFFGNGSSAAPTAGTPNVTITGPGSGEFGQEVAGIGDFNDDGRPDFAIAAPTGARVYVFFGRASGSPWPATVNVSANCSVAAGCVRFDGGTSPLGTMGWSLAGVGDFNNDGVDDLGIGEPFYGFPPPRGRVWIVLGGSGYAPSATGIAVPGPMGAEVTAFAISGPGTTGQFGNGLAGLGDMDGDGFADIGVGAAGAAMAGLLGGAYFVTGQTHSGSGIDLISGAPVVELRTGAASAYGQIVTNIGDYDDDGHVDLAVYRGLDNGGSVEVFRGGASGFSAARSILLTNDLPRRGGDVFGRRVARGWHPSLGLIGDVDGDGHEDILASSEQRSDVPGAGDLLFGAAPAADRARSTAEAYWQPASTAAGLAERRVAFAGDINGDGHTDLVLGDPYEAAEAGRFFILY